MDVNGAFHGEPVAGPGAEVAKAGEACDAVPCRLLPARDSPARAALSPGDAVLDAGGAVVVDGGGVGEDFVIDGSDLIKVRLDSIRICMMSSLGNGFSSLG